MMSEHELKRAATLALTELKRAGAAEALAEAGSTRHFSLRTRNGQVELLKESVDLSLSMRVFANRRFGGFQTSDLHPERLPAFCRKAVEMVKLTDEDPQRSLPPEERTRPLPAGDLGLYDAALAASLRDRAADLCQAMTAAAQGVSPDVIHVDSSFEESEHQSLMLSSAGFEGARRSTRASLSCNTYVKDGQRKQSGGDYRAWRTQAAMTPPAEVGRTGAIRAMEMQGARPLKTADLPLVIVNYWGDKFTGMLLQALDGGTVHRGLSCLGAKLGQKVAPERLTISDEPLLPGALGTRAYDSEGMVSRSMPLLEQGVLRNFYFSSYWAKKHKAAPTTADPSNLVFAPGQRSGQQMAASLDRGLFITDFIGGNFNALSGDFSAGIRGFLMEKGKRVQPVAEMNLAGNLLTLLPLLQEVGNDPYPFMDIRSPSLRFAPLTVSGT